jgi:hypothetical protein
MLALLMRYPITLNRNVIIHSVVFSAYFLSNTAIFFATQAVEPGRAGNAAGDVEQGRGMPGREEKPIGQLNSLNMALLRAARD